MPPDAIQVTDQVLICSCGATIPDSAISHFCCTNEEGEEFALVEAWCQNDRCGKRYEANSWGCCEDLKEAKEVLIEHYGSTQLS